MKYGLLLLAMFCFNNLFSQWQKIAQLPSSDIFTIAHYNGILYAGGTKAIYFSRNNGNTWDSTAILPGTGRRRTIIDNIIVFHNELYAAVHPAGVFKSTDHGITWQSIDNGIDSTAAISDFCEYRGNLYAGTDGGLSTYIYRLDSLSRNRWISFSNGLTNISTNVTSIVGTGNALVAGTNANALYDYLPGNSTIWEQRFLLGQISPNEKILDIIHAHDTMFLAGTSGKMYISVDNGLTWELFGNRLISSATFMVNAKQAVLLSTRRFDGVSFNSVYFYIKKDSLDNAFVRFSTVPNLYTYKLDIASDKLWAATDHGLYFMSLAAIPGITADDDSLTDSPATIHFNSTNAQCRNSRIELSWNISQDQDVLFYSFERSIGNDVWFRDSSRIIGQESEKQISYSILLARVTPASLYRIVVHFKNGRIQYSDPISLACTMNALLTAWPNPVIDQLQLTVNWGQKADASVKLFDARAALINMKRATLVPGMNHIMLHMSSLAKGTYYVHISTNDGKFIQAVQVIKL